MSETTRLVSKIRYVHKRICFRPLTFLLRTSFTISRSHQRKDFTRCVYNLLAVLYVCFIEYSATVRLPVRFRLHAGCMYALIRETSPNRTRFQLLMTSPYIYSKCRRQDFTPLACVTRSRKEVDSERNLIFKEMSQQYDR